MAKWNVMVYLAGDNNLGEEMIWALKDMQAVDMNSNTVRVQFDPLGTQVPVQRYIIRKNRSPLFSSGKPYPPLRKGPTDPDFHKWFMLAKKNKLIRSRCKFEPENTGNPTSLLDFVWWATGGKQFHREKKRGQSKNQMLIISGHGSGIDSDFLASDNSSMDSLTIKELSNALSDVTYRLGRKIDILGLDSCLMSTAEVYYEVRDYVNFLVASEGFEPNSGWPYGVIMNKLSGSPDHIAKKIVRDYIQFYFEYALCGQSLDLSACHLKHASGLKDAVEGLAAALKPALNNSVFRKALIYAHWRAQSYKSDQYVDLVDFAEVLKREVATIDPAFAVACRDFEKEDEDGGDDKSRGQISEKKTQDLLSLKGQIDRACQKVMDTVLGANASSYALGTDGIVLESGYVGPAFQYSKGLSIYFPWSKVSCRYGQLQLASDTGWNEFVRLYIAKTRRSRRDGYPPAEKSSFLARIMDPYKLDAARTGTGRADDPNNRADDPNNRADDPNNRADDPNNRGLDPYNRGKIIYRSMNNAPVGWRGCELLKRSRKLAGLLSTEPVKGE